MLCTHIYFCYVPRNLKPYQSQRHIDLGFVSIHYVDDILQHFLAVQNYADINMLKIAQFVSKSNIIQPKMYKIYNDVYNR